MTRSVVIVGAGIIGCAIARELSARGAQCTVVDPRPVGGGATQASAGMLAPYVEAHAGGPMLDLCVRSLDLYDDWIGALRGEGAEIEYRRIGTLEIALSEERVAALRGGHGEWLDRDAVARIVPQLGPAAGALRNERHGYVDARQLAQALAQSAERHGAAYSTVRVERIDRRTELLSTSGPTARPSSPTPSCSRRVHGATASTACERRRFHPSADNCCFTTEASGGFPRFSGDLIATSSRASAIRG